MREKREHSRRVESDALNQAKKRAQEILDLSAADIDNFLNSDTDSDSEEVHNFMSIAMLGLFNDKYRIS